MSNQEVYDNVFIQCFSLDKATLTVDLKYNEIAQWDSIGHMEMIAALEEAFKISLDADDIVNFSSYKKGQELLSKYNVKF